jgi:hypothetical protein
LVVANQRYPCHCRPNKEHLRFWTDYAIPLPLELKGKGKGNDRQFKSEDDFGHPMWIMNVMTFIKLLLFLKDFSQN